LLATWSLPSFLASSAANPNSIAAVSRASNTMEVWWVSKDGSVNDAFFYDGQPWRQFQLAPAGSASTTGGITAVSRASNTMEVWWVGAQGSIQDAYFYDNQGWRQFQLAPNGSASTTASITAVSRASNTMEVWWEGAQGSIQDAYFYDNQGWRQFQLAPNGSASTRGSLKAVSRASNTMEVFWEGAQGSIQDAYFYDNQGWRQFQLAPNGSASTNGGLTAVSRAPNTMEVWWVGPQGSVQDAYFYDNQGWRQFQLAPNGSASTTGGISAVSRASNTMEVFWVGPLGSIQDAYFYDNQGWRSFQLAPNGSASTTGGVKVVSRASNTMELWWAGADNSVQDAYFYDNSGWNRFQLAPFAPANPAAATAYSAPPAGTPLYNGGTPSYLDVRQGAVGDCWLVASLAEAAARQPQLITSMFTYDGTTVVNGSTVGLYTVRLYDTKGFPVYMQVDATLPSGGYYYDRVTTALGTSSLWVALAEKAYAMANGMGYVTTGNLNQDSYAALNNGWPSWALSAIIGRSAGDYTLNTNDLVTAWNAGRLVVLCTSSPASSLIVGSHCYAMVGYTPSSSQPFKMFNPWGTDANGWAPGQANKIYGLFTANAAFLAQNYTKESFSSSGQDAVKVADVTPDPLVTVRSLFRRRGPSQFGGMSASRLIG
jgi:hypothetical protein